MRHGLQACVPAVLLGACLALAGCATPGESDEDRRDRFARYLIAADIAIDVAVAEYPEYADEAEIARDLIADALADGVVDVDDLARGLRTVAELVEVRIAESDDLSDDEKARRRARVQAIERAVSFAFTFV